jgi:hypothetical protein
VNVIVAPAGAAAEVIAAPVGAAVEVFVAPAGAAAGVPAAPAGARTPGSAEDFRQLYGQRLHTEFSTPTEGESMDGADVALNDDVNAAAKQVSERIVRAAEAAIGKKRVGPSTRSWWDKELEDVIARRHVALLVGNEARYRALTKEARQLAKEKKCAAASRTMQELEELQSLDNKRFWAVLKRLGGMNKSPGIAEVQLPDGSKSKDPEVVLDTFKQHFDTLGNQGHDAALFDAAKFEQVSAWAARDRLPCPMDRSVGTPPSKDEIIKAIAAQAVGAPGNDGIPMELLKYGGIELAGKLERLFRIWWTKGETPSMAKEATIFPLHKKDDPAIPNNYRGIALLNVIGKIYARVLCARLTEHVSPLLCKEQGGFIRGRNTVDQAYVLADALGRAKANNQPAYVAFLDLAKAYDTVWRDALWFKLAKMGVSRKLRKVIEELVSNSSYQVRIDGPRSEAFEIRIGLRQGCVLSPILFDVFINDFVGELPVGPIGINVHAGEKTIRTFNLHTLLFADDVAFVASTEEKLQDLLDLFNTWCNKWRMVISVNKSKFMAINHKRVTGDPTFTIAGRGDLERVKEFKYLGVYISESLSWEHDAKMKLSRYNEACRAAHGVLHNRFLSLWDRTRVWAALCRPHLEYGAEVIRHIKGSNVWRRLCAAQMRTLRAILHLPEGTCNDLVLAETGLVSLEARYNQAHLSFLFRLHHGVNNILPKEIFARALPPKATAPTTPSKFLKEEYTALYNTVESEAKAEFDRLLEKAVKAESEGKPAKYPDLDEVRHKAIRSSCRSRERSRLLVAIATRKAPAAAFFTAPQHLAKRGAGFLKRLPPSRAAVMLRARLGVLTVGARLRHFGKDPLKGKCASCIDAGSLIDETLQHLIADCPANAQLRVDHPILAGANAMTAVLNPAAGSLEVAGEALYAVWRRHLSARYSDMDKRVAALQQLEAAAAAAERAAGRPPSPDGVAGRVLVTPSDQPDDDGSNRALPELDSDLLLLLIDSSPPAESSNQSPLAPQPPLRRVAPRVNGHLPQADL